MNRQEKWTIWCQSARPETSRCYESQCEIDHLISSGQVQKHENGMNRNENQQFGVSLHGLKSSKCNESQGEIDHLMSSGQAQKHGNGKNRNEKINTLTSLFVS